MTRLVAVGGEEGDPVGPAPSVERVGVAMHIVDRSARFAPPAAPTVRRREHRQGDAVRPQDGPNEELVRRAQQATLGQRHGLDHRQVDGPVVRASTRQVAHQRPSPRCVAGRGRSHRRRCRWSPRRCRRAWCPGFWACRWKKSFHFSAGGRNAATISSRLRRCAQGGALGGAGEEQVPRSSRWNRLSACRASSGE